MRNKIGGISSLILWFFWQYEEFLDQLSEVMKVDSIAVDLGFDMRLKLILSRSEQLVNQETTALMENKSLTYSLQRKVTYTNRQTATGGVWRMFYYGNTNNVYRPNYTSKKKLKQKHLLCWDIFCPYKRWGIWFFWIWSQGFENILQIVLFLKILTFHPEIWYFYLQVLTEVSILKISHNSKFSYKNCEYEILKFWQYFTFLPFFLKIWSFNPRFWDFNFEICLFVLKFWLFIP